MTGRLAGRVALVTGAAGGIGAAIARRFAAEGASVVGADIEVAGEATEPCDVADPASVDGLVAAAIHRHGRIDVLVHAAAALGGSGNVLDVDRAEWDRFIRVNLTGSFLVAQAVAKTMRAAAIRGRIVLLGSVNSFAAEPEAVPYVASKGGVRMLSKALAVDLAAHGITVNLLAPGAVVVPRNASLFASEPVASLHARSIPLGGPGLPEQLAAAALYLADPESAYTTGSELVVDGGLLARIF